MTKVGRGASQAAMAEESANAAEGSRNEPASEFSVDGSEIKKRNRHSKKIVESSMLAYSERAKELVSGRGGLAMFSHVHRSKLPGVHWTSFANKQRQMHSVDNVDTYEWPRFRDRNKAQHPDVTEGTNRDRDNGLRLSAQPQRRERLNSPRRPVSDPLITSTHSKYRPGYNQPGYRRYVADKGTLYGVNKLRGETNILTMPGELNLPGEMSKRIPNIFSPFDFESLAGKRSLKPGELLNLRAVPAVIHKNHGTEELTHAPVISHEADSRQARLPPVQEEEVRTKRRRNTKVKVAVGDNSQQTTTVVGSTNSKSKTTSNKSSNESTMDEYGAPTSEKSSQHSRFPPGSTSSNPTSSEKSRTSEARLSENKELGKSLDDATIAFSKKVSSAKVNLELSLKFNSKDSSVKSVSANKSSKDEAGPRDTLQRGAPNLICTVDETVDKTNRKSGAGDIVTTPVSGHKQTTSAKPRRTDSPKKQLPAQDESCGAGAESDLFPAVSGKKVTLATRDLSAEPDRVETPSPSSQAAPTDEAVVSSTISQCIQSSLEEVYAEASLINKGHDLSDHGGDTSKKLSKKPKKSVQFGTEFVYIKEVTKISYPWYHEDSSSDDSDEDDDDSSSEDDKRKGKKAKGTAAAVLTEECSEDEEEDNASTSKFRTLKIPAGKASKSSDSSASDQEFSDESDL